MEKLQHFAFRYRGLLISIPIIVSLFCRNTKEANNLALWVTASIVFLIGLLIRIWAQQHLHFRLKIERTFTTAGPYRLVRNPIYIGNTLISISLIIASGQLWLLPIQLLVCFIVFPFVVAHEERYLKECYGEEYENYLKSVPRWLPKFNISMKPEINSKFLNDSVKAELYNFLFFIPMIIKDIIT